MSSPSALTETLAKRVVELEERNAKLTDALEEAKAHLEFCGYGDSYERESAADLPRLIEDALKFNKGE